MVSRRGIAEIEENIRQLVVLLLAVASLQAAIGIQKKTLKERNALKAKGRLLYNIEERLQRDLQRIETCREEVKRLRRW